MTSFTDISWSCGIDGCPETGTGIVGLNQHVKTHEDADVASGVVPATHPTISEDPWVSDLDSSFAAGECQSTVGFDNHPCEGAPRWYVELEVWENAVANPRWEGKLCNSCLAGWLEWASEEPDKVRAVSVSPIVTGN